MTSHPAPLASQVTSVRTLGGAEWLELSHSVAPPSEGMCTRANTDI